MNYSEIPTSWNNGEIEKMEMMNRETKAVADVACEHFSADGLSDFLERYDDQNKAVKELAGLIKGFYEHDLHYVADDGFKIATEVLRVVLELVDFEAVAKYCIDTYLGFDEN